MFLGLVVTAVGSIGGSVGPFLQLLYSAIFPSGGTVFLGLRWGTEKTSAWAGGSQ